MLNEDTVEVFRQSATGLTISVEELVVGDVFAFTKAMKIPADGIIIEAENVECDESPLTGEIKPQQKKRLDEDSMLAGAKTTLFAQTQCTGGSGKGLVTAVGVSTLAGQQQVEGSKDLKEETPL
jgi:Ca2+-transporting ATPase